MKKDFFVNAVFEGKTPETQTVTARLRGVSNGKSFKLSEVPNDLNLEQNDGVSLDLSGELTVTENYVTVSDYKVIDVKKGAYTPQRKIAAEELLAEMEDDQADAPLPTDDDVPFI